MKIFTLLLSTILMTLIVNAQSKMKVVNESRLRHPAPAITADVPVMPLQAGNLITNSKAALESTLGGSRYDMQTNQAISSRICLFPDGTMSGVWTQGFIDSNYPDRGTGYDYFDGTAWGPAPTARIEDVRTGWPCIQPWNGNGEIIVCHKAGTTDVLLEKRPVKGTGAWISSTILPPAGTTGIGWPRILTSGPNHNFIHMILITTPTGNGGTAYQGLDAALLYYRSPDGGVTWDKDAVILPQLTTADYDGFTPDTYAWGTAHGDTIYFALGAPYTDTFIMKSDDNGNNWTKIPVLSNANKKIPAGTTSLPEWKSSDGAMAVEMDHAGIIHAAFGVGAGYIDAGSKYIIGNYNGLVYWNTTMPMLQDSLILDTLDVHGQLLAYVSNGPGPGDTIIAVPFYRVSLSSFPQITVDEYNNLFFLWSAATPGDPSPDPYNYRHIWGRARTNNTQWNPPYDLNAGILYMFQEYVYQSVTKTIRNDNLEMIYQTSPQPGSNIADATIPVHDVTIEHRSVPIWMFLVGIDKKDTAPNFNLGLGYPNPVKGMTNLDLTITSQSAVSVDVVNTMGRVIMKADKGTMPAGKHKITLDAGNFAPGIYFCTVTVSGNRVTRKIVVQ